MKSAFEIYKEMLTADFRPVIQFMLRENESMTEIDALQGLDGVIQWMAGHAAVPHMDQTYVMLNGSVDDAFHAFILNTRLYMKFCKEHVGFFIHHTPVEDHEAEALFLEGGIDYTITFLEDSFGDQLSSSLKAWSVGHKKGALKAVAVSCKFGMNIAEDPSILKHFGIPSIVERWKPNIAA
jgi:hypothetical protein